MAKPTIASLTTDNLDLTATIVTMGAEIATLRQQLLDVTSVASEVNRAHRAPRPTYVAPQWQLDRVAAMAEAKAAAMAGHCLVRV